MSVPHPARFELSEDQRRRVFDVILAELRAVAPPPEVVAARTERLKCPK